jgi:hypothetical protein
MLNRIGTLPIGITANRHSPYNAVRHHVRMSLPAFGQVGAITAARVVGSDKL